MQFNLYILSKYPVYLGATLQRIAEADTVFVILNKYLYLLPLLMNICWCLTNHTSSEESAAWGQVVFKQLRELRCTRQELIDIL